MFDSWMVGWMDVGWLEKAELKPTQPSLAGAWLSLAIFWIKVLILSLEAACPVFSDNTTYCLRIILFLLTNTILVAKWLWKLWTAQFQLHAGFVPLHGGQLDICRTICHTRYRGYYTRYITVNNFVYVHLD